MFIFSGPLRSRAAKAIGFIDMMIDYSIANAPLQKELSAGKLLFLALSILFDRRLSSIDSQMRDGPVALALPEIF